jgi:uncharacterized protein YjgD (DUF1641 family)
VTSVPVIANARTADPADVLAERLSDPRVASSLNTLLDHADLLALLVTGLDGLLSRGDTITDSIADSVSELRTAGGRTWPDAAGAVDTVKRLAVILPLFTDNLPALESLLDRLPVLVSLLSSDLADPRVIDLAGAASRAVVTGANQAAAGPAPATGIRALLRALKDPDVSRALGVGLTIAKAFGKEINQAG